MTPDSQVQCIPICWLDKPEFPALLELKDNAVTSLEDAFQITFSLTFKKRDLPGSFVVRNKYIKCSTVPSAENGPGAPFCLPLPTSSPSVGGGAAGTGSRAWLFKKEKVGDV